MGKEMDNMFKKEAIGKNYHNCKNICEGDNIIITECDFIGHTLKGKIKGKVMYFNTRACFGIKTDVKYGIHLSFDNIPFKCYRIDKK
jgi:hypothetical protein